MKRWLKGGQRVKDEFLGAGTVVEVLTVGLTPAAIIRFDETPPYEYNLGSNPCLRFQETLKSEE